MGALKKLLYKISLPTRCNFADCQRKGMFKHKMFFLSLRRRRWWRGKLRGGGGGGVISCGSGGIINVGGAFCCFVSFNPRLFLLCLNITSFLLNSLWQSGQFLSILPRVRLLSNYENRKKNLLYCFAKYYEYIKSFFY